MHNYNLNAKPNETEEFHIKVFPCKYLEEHCTVELQDKADELFWDKEKGGYFAVAEGDSSILIRMKDGK